MKRREELAAVVQPAQLGQGRPGGQLQDHVGHVEAARAPGQLGHLVVGVERRVRQPLEQPVGLGEGSPPSSSW